MIAQLTGVLSLKDADRVVVDIHGVGYEVLIPFSTYYELGDVGDKVKLDVHTHVREDTLTLYGFQTKKEKKLFLQLIQVSGIGPRLGIAILSGLPVEDFVAAVSRADIARLSSIPGVGKKTAQRIALEMKDKVVGLVSEEDLQKRVGPQSAVQQDVVSALVNLGYPKNKAEAVVGKIGTDGEEARFEDVLKKSLKELSG